VIHVALGAPRYVIGDPVRLRQVVLNLVGNAIKFTERGSVTIAVQGQYLPEGQTLMHLSVTDTGAGIPPEIQARLFTPFAQADASTARRYGGTGLGLAISKRLVDMMGGVIELRSEVGMGSTFGLQVPIEPAEIHGARVPWPTPPPGRRVLVVDDLDVSRTAITDTLKRVGVDVTAVTSGAAALEMLRTAPAPFDAIVADAPLADMDPAAFAQAFQEPRLGTIPRIMLAARPRPGALAVAEAQGWAAYLPKPARSAVLLAAVEATTREPGARPKGIVTRHSIAEALRMPGASGTKREAFKGVLALVADDVRLNQMVAKVMLESLGCTVEVVDDGQKAIERVERGGVDVVFMDMHMPDMDGPQATRVIRAMEGPLARIPIIALSAGVLSDERKACLDAGMDEFVAKPVRPEELARALGTILQKRDTRMAA
jgi:CheY-like chemotaxis protein